MTAKFWELNQVVSNRISVKENLGNQYGYALKFWERLNFYLRYFIYSRHQLFLHTLTMTCALGHEMLKWNICAFSSNYHLITRYCTTHFSFVWHFSNMKSNIIYWSSLQIFATTFRVISFIAYWEMLQILSFFFIFFYLDFSIYVFD